MARGSVGSRRASLASGGVTDITPAEATDSLTLRRKTSLNVLNSGKRQSAGLPQGRVRAMVVSKRAFLRAAGLLVADGILARGLPGGGRSDRKG